MGREEWEGRDGMRRERWEGRDGKGGTVWEGNMIYVNVREKMNNF